MRISGLTIARDAVRFDYPLQESIRSLLPLVDELIVAVGDCEDGTWELVQAIGDAKIKPFRTVWDVTRRVGGEVLSEETNKALERCTGEWAVYLQADEVLHEEDLPGLRAALDTYRRSRIEALSFRCLHFYGSYRTVQDHPRWFYRRAVRAVRLGAGIRSVGDACAFLALRNDAWRPPRRRSVGVRVFHYGWVRPPEVMARKCLNSDRFYHDDAWLARHAGGVEELAARVYDGRGHLRYFHGTHPAVMRRRVESQTWSFDPRIDEQWPDWVRHLRIALAWPLGDYARRALRRVRGEIGR